MLAAVIPMRLNQSEIFNGEKSIEKNKLKINKMCYVGTSRNFRCIAMQSEGDPNYRVYTVEFVSVLFSSFGCLLCFPHTFTRAQCLTRVESKQKQREISRESGKSAHTDLAEFLMHTAIKR